MNKTKKDIVADALFLIALAAVVIGFVINILVSGKGTAEASVEPTTAATTEETSEPTQEPTESEPTAPVVTESLEPIETTEATESPETTEVPETTEPPYTEQDLEYLAMVIYQEAGADYISDETRLMVGTVVMNRVADPRFPETIYDVLTQKGQYGRFHWTGLVWADRASYATEAHAVQRAYECAEKILSGYRAFGEGVIWQAEFAQGSAVVEYQDGIYFCE